MAQFRVNDQVKVVSAVYPVPSLALKRIGKEGVITNIDDSPNCPIWVSFRDGDSMVFQPCELAPLTDPGAESFIARIKKLGSEPVNDAPKVTVREGK